jgi:putative ATP-dependent DNA ligase
MREIAEALGLSFPAFKELCKRDLIRKAFIKHPFFSDVLEAFKLDRKFGEFEEGTLIAKTVDGVEVVRGYPKIKRALTLYPTIKRHFKGEVAIEEKMNGYNVRIVKFGKNLYAITRGGFICPYTTEKARKLLSDDIFKDHPNLMLCCEAVGEESPFVPKSIYGSRINFYVFDIRDRRTNKALPIYEKLKLAEEYGFKIAEIFDVVDAKKAHEVAREVVERIGKEGREGIVIKDVEMVKEPIKYTTSQTNCSDLSYAFRYFGEYGRDFMFSRLIREGFQSFEFGEDEQAIMDRCIRIGEAILKSMVESIREVSEGKKVYEKMRLRFYDLDVFELFKQYVRRMGIDAKFSEPMHDGDGYVVWFYRYMKSTTDKIKHILKGNLWS